MSFERVFANYDRCLSDEESFRVDIVDHPAVSISFFTNYDRCFAAANLFILMWVRIYLF